MTLSEQQIIANVMGYWPPVSTTHKIYVRNTLRGDKKPGCWFAYKWGELRLFDYGDARYNKANYFDLVALKHFGTRTEYKPEIIPEVKRIIKEMAGGPVKKYEHVEKEFHFDLRWEGDALTKEVIDYYDQYGITEGQLVEDRVVSVNWYMYNSRHHPKLYDKYYPNDLCIALPRGSRTKIYRPYQTNGPYDKWVTDTTRDDYYHWSRKNEMVLIFGSHKDGRAAFNYGHSVWAWQSETAFPSDYSIEKFKQKYKLFLYVGDIDTGGLKNAEYNIRRLKSMDVPVLHACMPLGLLQHDIKDFAALRKTHPEHAGSILKKTIDQCMT